LRRRHIIAVFAVAALAASPAFADPGTASDEARLFDWIRTFWPMLVLFGGLIVAGIITGLSARFVASARFELLTARVDKVEGSCAEHDLRLKALEKASDASPTRVELQEDVAEVSERLARVETGLTGIGGQLETTNLYLHTIIERGLGRPA
jgi:hypothetical protein